MKEKLRARLLKVFEAEHAEHLTVIRQVLETASAGALSPEAINEAFRRAHSLKGAARAVDLSSIEKLAHHLESLLHQVQEAKFSLGPNEINIMHQVLDLSEDLLAHALGTGPAPHALTGLHALEQLLGIQPSNPTAAKESAQPARPVSVIEPETTPMPTLVTPAAPRPHEPVALTENPAVELTNPPPEIADIFANLAESFNQSETETQSETPAPSESPSTEALAAFRPEPSRADQLRISASRLSALLETADRLQAEGHRQRQAEQLTSHLLQELGEFERFWEQQTRHINSAVESELDANVRSRIQALSRLGREARALQRQSSWKLGQEVGLLQQDIREVRMLPARELFMGFPKMLRELAQEQNKHVQIRFLGWEIEADRAVLEALKDPIMHSLRNAVAHGIELPHERQVKGKEATGQILCKFSARGHTLCVEISDDGRGLDEAQIRSQSKSDDQNWQQNIFKAGFSTSRQVNRLSGRGMGLSVVADTIRKLSGELKVDSRPELGFTLTLEVPLHIATTHLLLVSAQDQIFALPSANITGLLRISPNDLHRLEGQQVIYHQQRPVPVISLSELLWHQYQPLEGPRPAILLRSGEALLALCVDSLLAERDSLLKPLSGPAAELSLFLGVVLSPEGEPIATLDSHRLFELAADAPPPPEQSSPELPPLILVVDDSITTRTLEQTILETHGYRVEVAVNGREALNLLQQQSFDVVISDVQMPEMDGLELLAAIKQDPALAETPVILVTSLQADQDRRRGLELGAEAYLVKQQFEQQDLLETLRRFV